MSQIWLQIFGVMIGGSIIKYLVINTVVWVVIDIAVLGVSYLILCRHPYINMRSSMIFLGGLTVINILVDIGIISGMVGNIALLVLLAWIMFGGGSSGGTRKTQRHKWHK